MIRREVRLRLRDLRLSGRFDWTDIFPSVMASFFVRAAARQYDLEQPDQLLRLLVVMTRHKLTQQVPRHRAGAVGGASDPRLFLRHLCACEVGIHRHQAEFLRKVGQGFTGNAVFEDECVFVVAPAHRDVATVGPLELPHFREVEVVVKQPPIEAEGDADPGLPRSRLGQRMPVQVDQGRRLGPRAGDDRVLVRPGQRLEWKPAGVRRGPYDQLGALVAERLPAVGPVDIKTRLDAEAAEVGFEEQARFCPE